jgi:predicted acetyltransferase/catechol 2,3-dioxygenase-like lactoylglutathione lyase family enzyme
VAREQPPGARLVPELDVTELAASLRFYTGVLGFRVLFDRPEERFAYLDLDGAHLMLEEAAGPGRRFHTAPLERPFGRGVNFQIEVADVDAIHARAVAAGCAIVVALEEKWYRRGGEELGNRQFVLADPDGYLLRPFTDLGTRAAVPRPEDARLVAPDPAYAAGYLEALREGFRDSGTVALDIDAIAADLPAHLARLNDQTLTTTLPDGRVLPHAPYAHLWLVAGEIFVGRAGVRYALNELLFAWGGHIGYEIRPSLRRQGFGMRACALAIEHARAHGIGRLLLTCADDNAGSARIIEAHGGVLEKRAPHPLDPGVTVRRYWIG